MNKLGYSELYLGRVLSADEVLARYDAVTCEDILGLARETLDFARVSFSPSAACARRRNTSSCSRDNKNAAEA